MNSPTYTIGQAVFVRTDLPDYAEETLAFKSLDELIQICTTPRPNCMLEKIIIQGLQEQTPVAVSLAFLCASRGQRPPSLQFESA